MIAYGELDNREIMRFIEHFSSFGPDVEKCFTQGNCFWFAYILAEEFRGDIMYNQVLGHFATLINGDLYDINGRIDNVSGPWEFLDYILWHDPVLYERLMRDCVHFGSQIGY